MKILIYIIYSLPILYFLYIIIVYFRVHVPYIKTSKHYFPTILKEMQITPQKIIYDLGCGKGDFLFKAEICRPKELFGYELSPLLVWSAQIKAKITKSKVKFFFQDFFIADLSKADIFYIFLVKSVVDKVWLKIKKECKSGTKVFVLGDKIDNETAIKEIILEPNNPKSRKVWVYQV
jgi:SAM-dependent methyltransferase